MSCLMRSMPGVVTTLSSGYVSTSKIESVDKEIMLQSEMADIGSFGNYLAGMNPALYSPRARRG